MFLYDWKFNGMEFVCIYYLELFTTKDFISATEIADCNRKRLFTVAYRIETICNTDAIVFYIHLHI